MNPPIFFHLPPASRPYILLSMLLTLVLLTGAGWQYVNASQQNTVTNPPPELEGGAFYVGGFGSDETAPAIAYSAMSEQYLSVFQTDAGNGNVWAQYVDALTGETIGPAFPISNDVTAYEGNPDVVYDPPNDRFLVVWDAVVCIGVPAHCNYVIKGRLLYGSEQSGVSNFAGDAFTVASQWSSVTTGDDLRDPAVAYNLSDEQFGIVFTHGQQNTGYPDIYGQIVAADASSPTVLTPLSGFEIWATGDREIKTPDIAWGRVGHTFAAAWNADRPSDTDYIAVSYLYDTYQGGDTQIYDSVLIAPTGSLQYDTRQPAIAYDELHGDYMLAFVHKEGSGTLSATTIRGKRLNSFYEPGNIVLGSFDIETTLGALDDFSQFPNLAYSSFDQQMYVSYATQGVDDFPPIIVNRTYIRVIVPAYDVVWYDSVSDRLEVRNSGELGIEHTTLACTLLSGRCLITWREEYTATDWDILGQQTQFRCFNLTTSVGNGVGSITRDLVENCNFGDQYRNGTTVEITAFGDELGQYTFDHWSGDLTGSQNPASILMNGNKTVTAHFVPTQPALDKYIFLPIMIK